MLEKPNIYVTILQSFLVLSSVWAFLFYSWRVGLFILVVDFLIGYHWQTYVKKKQQEK